MTMSLFGPDFPFAYDDWIAHPAGIGALPDTAHGAKVAIIGSGAAGIVAGYELMKLGARPVVFEAGAFGGRLRSHRFEGTDVIAEMGGMRFPVSSRGFWHYADLLGLDSAPFPNPLTPAAGSTVIDLLGQTHYAQTLADLPALYHEVAEAYDAALEQGADFTALKQAIADRDPARIKEIWDPIVRTWDERTFYDFVASSRAFQGLSFRHREVFGQVGFGTGGWDSDFPNSMLEILRVNATECDENQRYIKGGVAQVPHGLWRHAPDRIAHWPKGTTLAALNGGAPRAGVARLRRADNGQIDVTDRWGRCDSFDAVVVTCQSHMLTTAIDTEERLFSHEMWMALDRTRYMQSAKTFVMVDRAFWKDTDPATGRDTLSMTLTDRMTRGTYLFDNGPDRPSVICLSYAWMTDALKVLPLGVEKRVELALSALGQIYPGVDIRGHIVGEPVTISWENEANFLGAFKGALPGHYRYNHLMFGHFMQDTLPQHECGIFLAGDGVSFTPAWVEGAVQTALNATAGVIRHLGGTFHTDNPSPCDRYDAWGPVKLP
ncbi:flavin monoamine oxidase family protein [Oceaniglobus indicus]|uniref:flavin monoamine oxidase family protein n=1 Tax=Oceaniglobus indicus TaxID=2047749 RepID=UPI000C18A63E|nr:NAD(P)/FAD-dependent oxidoreductase [Oceaniglobus indicus]